MKILMRLANIAATIVMLGIPGAAGAQTILVEPFPSRGYSSTKVYVPPTIPNRIYNNRSTSYERINPSLYPANDPFGSSTTIYTNSDPIGPTYRQDPAQPVNIVPQNTYPFPSQSK